MGQEFAKDNGSDVNKVPPSPASNEPKAAASPDELQSIDGLLSPESAARLVELYRQNVGDPADLAALTASVKHVSPAQWQKLEQILDELHAAGRAPDIIKLAEEIKLSPEQTKSLVERLEGVKATLTAGGH